MKMLRSLLVRFAVIACGCLPPGALAVETATYDLSRDFSISSNPNGVWSYGWKSTLDGSFTPLPVSRSYVELGIPLEDWIIDLTQIQVVRNSSTNLTYDNGETRYPPGAVALSLGSDAGPVNYCVVRFTAPNDGGTRIYSLESLAESRLYGGASTDSDFHVLVNRVEVYGAFLPPNSRAGYTNELALNPGDTVDFVCGRGADGKSYGSGILLKAALTTSFPCTPRKAKATAQMLNGGVVGATLTDTGCGYTNTPPVLIKGGGGYGATARAVVSDGLVTQIEILDAGCCYTNTPRILIASPPFVPRVNIATSRVKVFQNVVLGWKYVLESSKDMVQWTPTGPEFVAEDEELIAEFDVEATGRYFRVRVVE